MMRMGRICSLCARSWYRLPRAVGRDIERGGGGGTIVAKGGGGGRAKGYKSSRGELPLVCYETMHTDNAFVVHNRSIDYKTCKHYKMLC